jgi:CubicO group peptidase (beta-lactamase class C family)
LRAVAATELERWLGGIFDDPDRFGETWAVGVSHRGRILFERYEGRLPSFDGTGRPVGPDTPLLSWSVSKSVLHLALGRLVESGRLDPSSAPGVAAWSADDRAGVTIEHLLTMRDGLDWVEDYDPAAERTDVVQMLFGGVEDMAAFAADRPLAAPPGSRYRYSSGSSLVLSGAVSRVVGAGDAYRTWLEQEVFGPAGMESATAGFDPAGTWVASSYVHATARDWLRFGQLYLDGGRGLVPPGWVDHGRRARSEDEDGVWHGAHWWTEADGWGTFWAEGYEGQFVIICPAAEAVAVRFGRSPDRGEQLRRWRRELVGRLVELA